MGWEVQEAKHVGDVVDAFSPLFEVSETCHCSEPRDTGRAGLSASGVGINYQ